jgi:hypothetical protein
VEGDYTYCGDEQKSEDVNKLGPIAYLAEALSFLIALDFAAIGK